MNLVESFSSSADKISKIHSCLKQDFPCSSGHKHGYSLRINCGGPEAVINDTNYVSDLESRGASLFYSGPNWALSSTGNFMDTDIDGDLYRITNTSPLSNINGSFEEIYRTARVSPLSLTYYGLCLLNGNYSVKLHFAEIVFSNDSSFNSLGRRVFDVYIQGKMVLKDFDIAKDAGGAGRAIVKSFNVIVNKHTLKIHLYWAGKGTTGIPVRGVYGPLISAISVDPNFIPPSPKAKKSYVILVAGVLAASLLFVLVAFIGLRRKGYLGGKLYEEKGNSTPQTCS
uniref:Malectin domain-containing protein n=1 Tax=Kalanchoe fedtschenkoi TaxID=63787 RepID=A0A7N0ZUM5_KALFE